MNARPFGFADAVELLSPITREQLDAYRQSIRDKYRDAEPEEDDTPSLGRQRVNLRSAGKI